MSADLSYVRKFPDTCDAETTAYGVVAPCGKLAVAARQDPEDYRPWPVCVYHSRKGFMVSLRDLLGVADA